MGCPRPSQPAPPLRHGRLAIAGLLFAAACSPAERLVGVSAEDEANRVALALFTNGVVDVIVERDSGGGEFEVRVPPEDLFDARRILDALELPAQLEADSNSLDVSSWLPDAGRERLKQARISAGELAGSLENLPGVVSAQVHLATRPDSPFESDSGSNAKPFVSASVLVTVEGDSQVEELEPDGIARFVASGLVGLEPAEIEVLVAPAVVRDYRFPGELSPERQALRDGRLSEVAGLAALRARFVPLYAVAAIASLLCLVLALDRLRSRSKR